MTELLFVGNACGKTLAGIGVKTIGDLAVADEYALKKCLGKNGEMLRNFALGRDYAEVTPMGYESEPKSVSNGMTFRANLLTPDDVSFAVTYLSMSVAERLRKHGLCCNTVAVTLRTPDMNTVNRQSPLDHPSCLYSEISAKAMDIIRQNQYLQKEIYSLSVHAERLSRNENSALQQQFFSEEWENSYRKHFSLETVLDSIRKRYGKKAINIASSINNHLI